tara:strand:+ start:493 stop:642 length:150 start_codon:yes stop_codon:yes gene_type:complete
MTIIEQLDTETLKMLWEDVNTDLSILPEIESELYHRKEVEQEHIRTLDI